MNDTASFFAPAPIQPTLYQENVCRPGWVQPIADPPSPPLYTPAGTRAKDELIPCSCTKDEVCETCWRERRNWFERRVAVRRQSMRNHARRLESDTPW